MKNGYGAYVPVMFVNDYTCISSMKNVAEKYGTNLEELLHRNGISMEDLKAGRVVTGCEFLMYMKEAGWFGTKKLPFQCEEDGYGDVVFLYPAAMPWDTPEWMPKSKMEAEKAVNLFLSILFMKKYDADFYDVD